MTQVSGPCLIPSRDSMSIIGWLRVYARARSEPTYYHRQRMWVVLHSDNKLYVAYSQEELKKLKLRSRDWPDSRWYEANIIDIEDALGYEITPD